MTKTLADYPHGPNAPQRAVRLAEEKMADAEAVVLVEGISDQIAVETLAERLGRDLDDEGVVVFPVGGAQALLARLREFGPAGFDLALAGLCDRDAVASVQRALRLAGVGTSTTDAEMAALAFQVCQRDLEDELIRAAGSDVVEAVIDSQGELRSFMTFVKQPEWRERDRVDQLHRFLRSHARRSQRYAHLLLQAIEPDQAPHPLLAVLASS